MLHEILTHKRAEVAALSRRNIIGLRDAVHDLLPVRSLRAALTQHAGVSIIAEIKRRSPSKGVLATSVDIPQRAQSYQQSGADALSVLTDSRFFHGSVDDLKLARSHVSLPVLRKDFVVSEYQVYESRAIGADAILLIAAALTRDELRSFHTLARGIGLEVLVEVHDQREVAIALDIGAELVGINNRDLRTFTVDLSVTERLAPIIPEGIVIVAESGVQSPGDMQRLRKSNVSAALVGESLMMAPDPGLVVAMLREAGQ